MLIVNPQKVTVVPVPNLNAVSPDEATEVYQQQYRETYVELAIQAQESLGLPVLRTFGELFKLGCTDPELSSSIDQEIAHNPILSDWPMQDQDCIGLISQGPYVQSQINFHGVPVQDVMQYVCDLFREMPDTDAVLDDIAA
ncbi:hypothetical protein [Acaryochloris marina]|uniref:hypothetical protein n=1 Tax=Acaryochloris marina TaxID=155978 RepID=UPI001BAECB23|nr:hypothetical protein [Acaryochloris marina]QUY40305.1 hypothetical protein I1H34_00360 [Acaryochloris marina S15]